MVADPVSEEGEEPQGRKPERKARKAKKQALPVAEGAKPPKLPTLHAVRTARRADLVGWLEESGLSVDGRVPELRARLSEYIEHQPRAPPEEVREAAPAAPTRKVAKGKRNGKASDEAGYRVRAKPVLGEAERRALAERERIASRRPRFLRQEWFRYRRLGLKWRRPQGGQSKLRRRFGYRSNVVSIGYRSPRMSRGLHPSGFAEVLVHNPGELEGLDATRQAVRIAHGVGFRKRKVIQQEADKLGLRVLNPVEVEE